jgi:hypothetical protein
METKENAKEVSELIDSMASILSYARQTSMTLSR